MRRLLKLILLSALLALCGCAVNPVTGRLELSLLSVEGEKRIGREVFLKVSKEDLSQGPFITKGFAVRYLQSIVDSFMPYYERRGTIPVTVSISPTAAPNAWSIPGYITVNLGLIPCMANEAQLAFVLGHELGHISARHTAQRYTKMVLLSLGVKAVGLYAGDIAQLVGNVAANLYLASYSRSQERMADALGFKYMTLAGYDPKQAAEAMKSIEICGEAYMKKLGMKRPTGIAGFFERLFADHPSARERFRILSDKAKKMGKKGSLERYRFSGLKAWAEERYRVLIHLDIAGRMVGAGRGKRALEEAEKAVSEVEKGQFEDEILAKVYSFSGFVNLSEKKYKKAWELAQNAIKLKRDYYVSYKVAGISGLRDETKEGLEVAEDVFSSCLEEMANDQDLISLYGKPPIDPVCLKGALVASCKLGKRERCRAYCKSFVKNFHSLTPDIVRFCVP